MTTKVQVHPSVTRDRVLELAQISMFGLESIGMTRAATNANAAARRKSTVPKN
jgi:hypothetical protein